MLRLAPHTTNFFEKLVFFIIKSTFFKEMKFPFKSSSQAFLKETKRPADVCLAPTEVES